LVNSKGSYLAKKKNSEGSYIESLEEMGRVLEIIFVEGFGV
jgi:hypothetical protein